MERRSFLAKIAGAFTATKVAPAFYTAGGIFPAADNVPTVLTPGEMVLSRSRIEWEDDDGSGTSVEPTGAASRSGWRSGMGHLL